jgi:hypothetical protein
MEAPLHRKSNLIIAGVFFVAAFCFSGAWILFNPQQPLPDPTLYEGIGANLAAGNGYSFDVKPPYRPELTRTPFLPFLISLLYRAVGREPQAVLWMNAFLIACAAGLAYLLALKLFQNRAQALCGSVVLILTPPFTGSANNILTEPSAMLQMVVIAHLLLQWKTRVQDRHALFHAGILGAMLATLALNRTSMIIIVLAAAAYVVAIAFKDRFKSKSAWLTTGVFCALLGAPVLAWSARNASLGLPFSPAPIGLYASRVFDMNRYADELFDAGEKQPKVNRDYFLHWKRHYGPEQLKELEHKNKIWFEKWRTEHSDRIVSSFDERFVGLFSFFRTTIFPPWPGSSDHAMRAKMRIWSRALWVLALAGMLIAWKNRRARYLFIIPVLGILIIHLPTVCHERYVFPLFPIHLTFTGVTLVFLWRKTMGLAIQRVVRRKEAVVSNKPGDKERST